MKKTQIEAHKSSLGMDANIASMIIFVAMVVVSWIPYLKWLTWVVPLVFFLLEKDSKFVRFQAINALAIGVLSAALSFILQIITWIVMPRNVLDVLSMTLSRGLGVMAFLGALSTIIGLAITVLIVYMLIMANAYKQVELPLIGPLALKYSDLPDSTNNAGATAATDNTATTDGVDTGNNQNS